MYPPTRRFDVPRKFEFLISTNTVENSLDVCANLFVPLVILVVNRSTRYFTRNVRIAIFLVMYARTTMLSFSDTSSVSQFRMLSSALRQSLRDCYTTVDGVFESSVTGRRRVLMTSYFV